jgi:hypothetical protein
MVPTASPSTVVSTPGAAAEPDNQRERRLTVVILLVGVLARLPFLWHGFGGHPDEWLVIRSGLDFWLHGTYFPSRPAPGFPFDEILMGGLAWLGGATACAAAATLASLVTLVYMRGLAPLYGIRNSFWLVLAFSFEPWIWSSGTHALDYIWGTGALVAAVYYIERRRFGAAGLACAVGFGFRPSSLLWIGPLFLRVLLVERRWKQVLRFVLWTAIPALIPTVMIASVFLSRPDASSFLGTEFNLIPSSILLVYHFIELMGHLPAVLIIIAACVTYRDRLLLLLRSREGWVWNYILIFACLLLQFWIESGKVEYMLPALPGLFMILGRCISDNWWKAIMAAFIFNGFVSFGLGHASHGSIVRIESITPSLRPGALLWYAARARASNDRVAQIGSELSEPRRIVRADPEMDRLDDFYVSSLLRRGPAAEARISCPLVPAFLSLQQGGAPEIRTSEGLPKPLPLTYPILVCCKSLSGLILSGTPSSLTDHLTERIRGFCAGDASTRRAGGS